MQRGVSAEEEEGWKQRTERKNLKGNVLVAAARNLVSFQ